MCVREIKTGKKDGEGQRKTDTERNLENRAGSEN